MPPEGEEVKIVPPKTAFIEVKARDFYQRLPYTPEGVELAKGLLDLIKKQIETKEGSESSPQPTHKVKTNDDKG